ncbi:MAG: hypothetical protein JWQ38_799 [Flavipsychrobacter sp.]|nr:hypothetical protein [Flavipsychrobacter sp.]
MSKFTSARPVQNIRHGVQLFRSRKTLWQMIREVLSGSYRMSWLTILIILVSIAYIVFPFDLIPDFIPFLGWLDDGVVLYLLLRRLVRETQRFNRFKAMERKG